MKGMRALLLALGFLAGMAFCVSHAQDQERKQGRSQQGSLVGDQDQDRIQDKDRTHAPDKDQDWDRDRDKGGKLAGPPDDAPKKIRTKKGVEDLPEVKLPELPDLPAKAQGPAKGALDAALTRASLALKNAGEASKLSVRYRNQARRAVDSANEVGRSGKTAGKGKGQ